MFTPIPVPHYIQTDEDSKNDQKLVLNVSGHRFETWRSTLEKHPDSLLGSRRIENFYDKKNGDYFFDRDSDVFKIILNYYRTGKLHFPRNECFENYNQELEFFGIQPSVISFCCYENYLNEKRENDQRSLEETKMEQMKTNRSIREKIWEAFDNPYSSTLAMILYVITVFAITVSVLGVIFETTPCGFRPGRVYHLSCGERYKNLFLVEEIICVGFFAMEYLIRLYASPLRWKFFKSSMSRVDLLATLPHLIVLLLRPFELQFENRFLIEFFLTLRLIKIFRIFKFSPRFKLLGILCETMRVCAIQLSFLGLYFVIVGIILGNLIYHYEKNVEGTNFTSILASVWYTMITITTLGYGDMIPETLSGKIIGNICALIGVIAMTLPIPIILVTFIRIYLQTQRDEKMKFLKEAHLAFTTSKNRKKIDHNLGNETIMNNSILQHHLMNCLEETKVMEENQNLMFK